MSRYLFQRLLHSIIVIFGVSVIVFVLVHLSGDPAATLVPIETTPEDLAAFRRSLGLDRPLPEQYVRFVTRALHGDMGISIRHKVPALPIVLQRLPATLQLAGAGLCVSLLIALPLGVLSALKRNGVVDHLSRVAALFGQAMPSFWLAILLIMFFSVRLHWFPVLGRGTLAHLVLPAITLGIFAAPVQMRLLRSSLLEVLRADYIRTAHAKGLLPRHVVTRHALKNAAIPFVTVSGLQIGAWLGGSLITETVFAYPGMGLLAINAMQQRDLPVIQAYVLVVGLGFVVANILIDAIYVYIDPRIRYG